MSSLAVAVLWDVYWTRDVMEMVGHVIILV